MKDSMERKISMLDKINQFLYRNIKRDYYSVKIEGCKNNTCLFNFSVNINVKRGKYPSRRNIAKYYGNDIAKHIHKYPQNKGCKITVTIITKIGSFKPKDVT